MSILRGIPQKQEAFTHDNQRDASRDNAAANTVPPKPQHLQLTCAFNKRVAVVPRTLLFTLERFTARHVAETVASIRHHDTYKEYCWPCVS
jgi:hypothetical protein